MPLPIDPKLVKLQSLHARAATEHTAVQEAAQKARINEDETRKQLYDYIREIGYCPHCELQLAECNGHGQVLRDRIRDRRRLRRHR